MLEERGLCAVVEAEDKEEVGVGSTSDCVLTDLELLVACEGN